MKGSSDHPYSTAGSVPSGLPYQDSTSGPLAWWKPMTVTSGTKVLLGPLGVEVPEVGVMGVKLPVGVRVSIVGGIAALELEPVASRAFSWLFVSARGLCEWWNCKLS